MSEAYTIDRWTPTQRPQGAADGRQTWQQLLFLHWPVPVESLRPLVPDELSIDTWEGQAYVGVVPFVMKNVAPWWWPSMLAFSFLETNLRTYVHWQGRDPGVYFFSLDAASRLAVWAARVGWGLPYYYADMDIQSLHDRHEELWRYQMCRRSGNKPVLSVEYTVGEALGPSQPDTFAYFLLERYLLYSVYRGKLWQGQVHHVPYPAYQATVHACREELVAAAGLPPTQGLPPIVHFSPGVDVEVFNIRPLVLGT